jgi:hypothetical protein
MSARALRRSLPNTRSSRWRGASTATPGEATACRGDRCEERNDFRAHGPQTPGALGTGRQSGGPVRGPTGRVHVDQTKKSGPDRLRFGFGPDAEDLLLGRFAIVNVWRPIRGPLLDAPLALCDARSVAKENLVASDLVFKDRVGETYAVTNSPEQRWFYCPRMTRNEALLLKCYDSATDVARFAPHGAFDDPTTPPSAPPRESIELRALVFFAK